MEEKIIVFLWGLCVGFVSAFIIVLIIGQDKYKRIVKGLKKKTKELAEELDKFV
jgi:hypothetical protein